MILAVSKTTRFHLTVSHYCLLLHTVSWLSMCNSLLSWCTRFFCCCALGNCGWFAVWLPQIFDIGIHSFIWTVYTVLSAAPFHLHVACCVQDPVTVVFFVQIILLDYRSKWCPLNFDFMLLQLVEFFRCMHFETAETYARRWEIFTWLTDSDRIWLYNKE